jgi:glycine/D-amino acid oxidase-like deaminating enzyme
MARTDVYDLAVVGTGIIGATAVALAAARDERARIVAVCAGAVHDGSTSRSLALDVPAGESAAKRELVAWSDRLCPLLGALAPSWRRRRYDSFWLAGAEQAAEIDGQLVGDRLAACDPAEQELLRSYFGQRLGGEGQLLRSGHATASDPYSTVLELLAPLIERPGNALFEGFAVERITDATQGYVLATADGRTVSARSVLAAPGAWAMSGPFQPTVEHYGARTKKVVAFDLAALDSPATTRRVRALLILEEHEAFLLPGAALGSWRLSIASRDWDCPPGRSAVHADAADLALAERVLAEAVPDFRAVARGSRVGVDLYLPDRLPLVVPLDGHERVVVATGGAGSGFRLAPAIADQALDLLGFRDHAHRASFPRPER